MTLDEFIKRADEVEAKTDCAVSWFAAQAGAKQWQVGVAP